MRAILGIRGVKGITGKEKNKHTALIDWGREK
jgi:hypothetical protein